MLSEHEQSLGRYMKLSKKKDVEKTRQDCSDDLYAMRKKFHQVSIKDCLLHASLVM